jgi:hypothetical protein
VDNVLPLTQQQHQKNKGFTLTKSKTEMKEKKNRQYLIELNKLKH